MVRSTADSAAYLLSTSSGAAAAVVQGTRQQMPSRGQGHL
jgi:hypothetical protein